MASVSVRLVQDDTDLDIARALCLEWLDWHWQNYPGDWPKGDDHPMEPDRFRAVVQDLHQLHARPKGGILIASVDGQECGCVMYHEARDGVAEFKRMFVSENGRGHGVGTRMLHAMFQQMIADGYRSVFFSSATFLTHAKTMYGRAGFVDMQQPEGIPDHWKDRIYFMQRTLA